ncbi:YggT family protein [Nocardia vinacea]|uniref:YggT family protein n=1 Tax=Nocardia vinacea TaxID=96468 RepID=A0ABZ1YQ54_9NOCA|nr:YggT family protein [Nocardia vinacea]
MTLIGTLLGLALTVFILLLLARLVLDWVGVLADGRHPQWVNRARDLSHSATEPVIAPVRRYLQPVRLGGLSIDLAFTVVFIVALVLRQIFFSL